MSIFCTICRGGFNFKLYSKCRSSYYRFSQFSTNLDKVYSSKYFQEIEDYFAHSPIFISERYNLNPKLFQLKTLSPDVMYLCNENTAEIVFEALKSGKALDSGCLFELNPGFGFLTERILSLTATKIKAFEKDSYFYNRMSQLRLKYPDQLQLYNVNLLNLRKMCYLDKIDNGSRFKRLMEGIDKTEWSDDPPIKIVGVLSGNKFLRYLTLNIIFQEGFVEYGRPQFFVLVDSKTYTTLCPESPFITPFSVLSRILFDIELLTTIDQRNYLPWIKTPTSPMLKRVKIVFRNIDYNKLKFVKITPKRDLFDEIGGIENLKPLWFFTRQVCKSGKSRVIPQVEKWVSGCGYRLITLNINAFTIFEDLSPNELLQVFLELLKWPEFKNSSFTCAMESILSKGLNSYETTDEKFEEALECEKDNLLEGKEQKFDRMLEYNKDSN